MRFHIGFSKRINVKKLIEILGFIFVMLLVFFGVYDTTHALTQVSSGLFDVYSYTEYTDSSFTNTTQRSGNVESSTTSYGYQIRAPYYNYDNTSYGAFISATTNLSNYHITKNLNYNINNGSGSFDSCKSSNEDLKSINFYFYLSTTNFSYNTDSLSFFNLSNYNYGDFFNIRMIGTDIYKETQFSTTCTKTLVSNYDGYWFVTCEGVFSGNSNYNIDIYTLQIYNTLPFVSMYKVSNDSNYINFNYVLNRMSSYVSPYDKTSMYECSDNKPIFDLDSKDPSNMNSIYDDIINNYDVDIPGINTNLMLLSLPNSIADLLMLPFDIVKAVINNSNVCTSYDIDFSSIMQKWGNSNSSYVLSLPCMRNVLSNKLGNWYTILDMLICFFVFYDITMHIIGIINAITYGEDLFGYFFQKSGNSKTKYVDSSTGEVLRNG